ncbi:hypothetical protein [Chlamydia trachomatis]|uniref:Membrane associated protein n=1 Tax=Chlamydia trachomatis serovar A (strain A2497) TaxID=580047 RepID=G4NPL6_CHLT4|nr:hypothetical protein [Chlamydia trachomatis]AEP35689.1 Hypothetical protein CTO_0866 [Chlamydia trachomatis A2497]CAX09468.1 putative exported protein [Chlamydia trachomatis A2497]CAX10362.1 putative exported protein [Chlamydia trachomatis B/TZ1A828/OT]CCP48192.1 hypothetical protein A363_00856 [Chlamydia trachomatis A/363]CCP49091.1 hypothetical protein A5291_00855 [Chlamydia trachomatis A/5291]
MRFLLALFSLIPVLPATEAFSTEDKQCQQEAEEDCSQVADTCVFYSYAEGLEHARDEGKLTLVVLLDTSGYSFETLADAAHAMESSLLSTFADFVVLSRREAVPLIYPPVPDPMVGEIALFLEAFSDQTFPSQPVIVTLAIGASSAEIMDITEIPSINPEFVE